MNARLLSLRGNSAVVVYETDDGLQACIVDAALLPSTRAGVIDLPENALATSTPYGIDWGVVYPDNIVITAQALQDELYALGLVSMSDLKHNPAAVTQVLLHLLQLTGINLYQNAKSVLDIGG